jgi:hypothetical protein
LLPPQRCRQLRLEPSGKNAKQRRLPRPIETGEPNAVAGIDFE